MAARKVAESRDLTVRVFARRWIDETLFYRSPAYVAQMVRWLDACIDPAIGDMQLADVPPGDVLAIIKARADTPVTSSPDGLGGWPLRSRQPDRQASMPDALRQGCAGAGLRPPLTRPAARRLKASWPLRMQRIASSA